MVLRKTVRSQLSTHDTDIKAVLTAIKGTGWSTETLKVIYDVLASGTYGLEALRTLILAIPTTPELEADALTRYTTLNKLISAIPTTPELEADALSRYTILSTGIGQRATPAQVLTQVQTEIGEFSGQTNLATLLAVLGIPDVSGKPLYTVLVTDRLDPIKTETDQLPNWVFNELYALDPVVDNVASASETALTACTFTPVFRTGATRVRVILHAYLHAAAQATGGHKIGLTLQYSKNGGAYADLIDLTASPPLVLPDSDEVMGSFAIAIDITTELDTSSVVYGFKWLADSDNAGSVNYTSNFEVVVTQSM